MTESQPTIATNRDDEQVARALNAHLGSVRSQLKEPPSVAISTAYFNPAGFVLMADELEQASRVRLLLGAEPQPEPPPIRRLDLPVSPERLASKILGERLSGHDEGLALDRDLLGFSREASDAARRLIDFVGGGRVEVRRLTDRFLHGKAFIVEGLGGGTMVGSSNFTHAGLATNLELNLFNYLPDAVGDVDAWFDEQWEAAEPFDLAGFYAERFEAFSPYWVYLRMLWEQYEAELAAQDDDATGFLELPDFSRDAVWRARYHIEHRDGVLLADDVGLGKTYQAGELIADRVLNHRDRVLVVAPAVLRDGPWRRFLRDRDLPVQVVSFEELVADKRLNPEGGTENKLWHRPNDYKMIVIDEAHNLRNPSTQRAEALRALLAGNPPKDVVLMTATPVNNSLWDLYHLLRFFVRSESAFANVGVPNMREHFAAAMEIDPEDLTAEALFDILDQVSVRRTRPFIKRYYPNAVITVDGQQVPVVFPTPRVRRVRYDFAVALPGFFEDFEHAIDGYTFEWGQRPPEGVLAMARYAPSMYHNDRARVENSEVQLAGLLRSMLLKRFESSPKAFAATCRKMASSHAGLIDLVENQGKVASGEVLADWLDTEGDDEEIAVWLESWEGELSDASDYDAEGLCADLAGDQELLEEFAVVADGLDRHADPKLGQLVDELADIAEAAAMEGVGDKDTRDKRKVLLFSYFTDTVNWIGEHLVDVCDPDSDHHDPRVACYHGRITTISAGQDKAEAMFGFAPDTTDADDDQEDLYDIIVATDVLAEGVNLQQARHVVNYDLPWNPQKLTQRHGRVDRLLSPHTEVFIRCFFPEADGDLDRLLGLEERLRRKMNQAVKVFGGMNWITDEQVEINFAHTQEEIAKLLAENPEIFEDIAAHALGGEEYRQQLRQVRDDKALMARIVALPWGAGSGFSRVGGNPGWVFCARIADHPRPVFRFLPTDPETFEPTTREIEGDNGDTVGSEYVIEDKVLTCLGNAQPFPTDVERNVPEDIADKVYDAWEIARDHIVERWMWAADPVNLAPSVPLSMREAEALVLSNPDNLLTIDQMRDLSQRLLNNYPNRITRSFRKALRLDTPRQRLDEIRRLIDLFALQPPVPPDPVGPITGADVHLVAWMAITPGTPE